MAHSQLIVHTPAMVDVADLLVTPSKSKNYDRREKETVAQVSYVYQTNVLNRPTLQSISKRPISFKRKAKVGIIPELNDEVSFTIPQRILKPAATNEPDKRSEPDSLLDQIMLADETEDATPPVNLPDPSQPYRLGIAKTPDIPEIEGECGIVAVGSKFGDEEVYF
ncbi:hypothetical protein CP533_4618 [Ophiocordyceps camponoti-saundersi (nom. inval.)]|nr:hypothetical protein CP533_4618 [Ophiocordyceps camponoti-saundersi (nom. inval.)]